MSQPQYGGNMDRPAPPAGSVKRARERAQAGYGSSPHKPQQPAMMDDSSPTGHLSSPPRRHMPPSQRAPQLPGFTTTSPAKARPPATVDVREGPIISRPTQAPHWPLPPGSPLRPGNNNDGYRPPPGRPLNAPPRPARPTRIPSMVDQSRPQQPTPAFRNPQNDHEEHRESVHDFNLSTPATGSSRLTTSSVGTIPEFPTPRAPELLAPPIAPTPRKSPSLGPPPTSRRGASSFYSNMSYVSPIPEESSRSHNSYASSAVMPAAWSPTSMGSPGYGEGFYDDSITEKSRDSLVDDFGDESKLFRSASIGKKTRAALVDNPPVPASVSQSRPAAKPVQMPFESGTGYTEESGGSSNTLPSSRLMPETSTGTRSNQFLAPMGMRIGPDASGEDQRPSPQPPPSRLSTMRRPPKLDIDAVRTAEARGSMTSLPDLIKRATRLAAMIEKGKRPASRFDNLNDLLANAPNGDKDGPSNDRHQSGLSDMLAAFPPPAQLTPNARQSGGSWFRKTSWPLAPSRLGEAEKEPHSRGPAYGTTSGDEKAKPARRCCGMPPWLFVLVIVLIMCAIAAAIVIPLQFFVFKTLGNHEEPQSALDKCQEDLSCRNGGTNVISQGVCSCICTNGFTGRDCSVGGSEGCTTTNLVSSDPSSTIEDVTLGKAIPRLIADANSNFSIPLSGTQILAKINNGDISCRAQNSLVTFDGRPMRIGQAKAEIVDVVDEVAANAAGVPIGTLTVTAGTRATLTIPDEDNLVGLPTEGGERSNPTEDVSAPNARPEPRSTDTNPTSTPDGDATGNFTVTEEVLDFARVAVLYILQEESSDEAETAQSSLQQFFSRARRTGRGFKPATEEEAQKITVGGENSVNLVDFSVDIGDGPVGRSLSKRSVFVTCSDESSGS